MSTISLPCYLALPTLNPGSYIVNTSVKEEEDMLKATAIVCNKIPGLPAAAAQPKEGFGNTWMAMKMQATKHFLNCHPDVVRQLPNLYSQDFSSMLQGGRWTILRGKKGPRSWWFINGKLGSDLMSVLLFSRLLMIKYKIQREAKLW
ncbi:hypothetical protein VP01_5946g1, partial [Puccinia sorghi]